MHPFWKQKVSERVLTALAECSNPDLPLYDLQVICLGILPEIKDDHQTQHQIVASRIKANDQAGVQWLLADPQRFPACSKLGSKVSNALDIAARYGHIDLLMWLTQDEDAKYWSNVRQVRKHCEASSYTLDAAVEGGNLEVVKEVASWEMSDNWKQDGDHMYKAAAAECQNYLENKQQGEDIAWKTGKHYQVLVELRKQGVSWDERSLSEAAKAGHLELIDWLRTDERSFKQQRYMQRTLACTMAIDNPDQDQAIETLKHLLKGGFPWKPVTRGFAGQHRQEQQPGLCETAASLGKLKVLKWLTQDPHALLPLCKGLFEMRQDSETREVVSTGIPLTPWEDGNSPGLIRTMAKKGLKSRDLTEAAIEMKMPQARMHEVTLADGLRNSAKAAAQEGLTSEAAQFEASAAEADAEIQASKDVMAWLDSPESGYMEHVKQQQEHYKRFRLNLQQQQAQQQQQQQQQAGAGTSAAAAAAGGGGAGDVGDDTAKHLQALAAKRRRVG